MLGSSIRHSLDGAQWREGLGERMGVEMARVEGAIIINRRVEDVFDFVADERNESRYNPRRVRAEQISEGPIGVGTQFRAELKTVGRTMPTTVEFTAYERPWRLGSLTSLSGLEAEGAVTFDSTLAAPGCAGRGTVRPRGVLRLISPIVGAIGRKQERRILGRPQAAPRGGARWIVSGRVLVAYGSEYGSTAEIANAIATTLRVAGAGGGRPAGAGGSLA
jgi:hypothetical protein